MLILVKECTYNNYNVNAVLVKLCIDINYKTNVVLVKKDAVAKQCALIPENHG